MLESALPAVSTLDLAKRQDFFEILSFGHRGSHEAKSIPPEMISERSEEIKGGQPEPEPEPEPEPLLLPLSPLPNTLVSIPSGCFLGELNNTFMSRGKVVFSPFGN